MHASYFVMKEDAIPSISIYVSANLYVFKRRGEIYNAKELVDE